MTTPGGTSANTAADNYTLRDPAGAPTVTALNPTSGTTLGGTPVTITGTNLTGATAVTFGGTAATSVVVVGPPRSPASARAMRPARVDVLVTTPGGTSANTAADNYLYVTPPAPTVTALNPTSGTTLGGTPVTITGTNLTGATAVTFGGTAATSVVVVNSTTSITCVSPGHAAGTVDVLVTTPGGTSANTAADNYTLRAAPGSHRHRS